MVLELCLTRVTAGDACIPGSASTASGHSVEGAVISFLGDGSYAYGTKQSYLFLLSMFIYLSSSDCWTIVYVQCVLPSSPQAAQTITSLRPDQTITASQLIKPGMQDTQRGPREHWCFVISANKSQNIHQYPTYQYHHIFRVTDYMTALKLPRQIYYYGSAGGLVFLGQHPFCCYLWVLGLDGPHTVHLHIDFLPIMPHTPLWLWLSASLPMRQMGCHCNTFQTPAPATHFIQTMLSPSASDATSSLTFTLLMMHVNYFLLPITTFIYLVTNDHPWCKRHPLILLQ